MARPGLLLLLFAVSYSAAADPAACDAALAAEPDAYTSALCYFREGLKSGAWQKTLDKLNTQAARYPEIVWLQVVRGYVLTQLGSPRAVDVYDAARLAFRAQGNVQGELLALQNLRIQLFNRGDVDGASELIPRVKAIGEATTDRSLRMRALMLEGRHLLDTNSNLDRAYHVLALAEDTRAPEDSYFVNRDLLNDLGQLNLMFGRYPQALAYFAEFETTARSNDDLAGVALAKSNTANTRYELAMEQPRSSSVKQLLVAAEDALRAAQLAKVPGLEILALRMVAEAQLAVRPRDAAASAKRCIAIAHNVNAFWIAAQCTWVLSLAQAHDDPGAARPTAERAIAQIQQAAGGEPAQIAYAWRNMMQVSWLTESPQQATRDSERALSVFESLRYAQATNESRRSVFSAWTRDYLWFAGQLLREPRSPQAVAHAFAVIERMRARNLYEALAAPDSANPPANSARRHAVDADIVRLNKALLVAGTEAATSELLRALGAAEREAERLRPTIARDLVRSPPALDVIQGELQSNEAILSLQIGHWENPLEVLPSGAWLLAITKDEVFVHKLPDRSYLTGVATMYRGALASGSPDPALTHSVYALLLGSALDALGPEIEELIIVPDAPLHTFAFASLSPSKAYTPLLERFDISVVPSVAAWLHWRTAGARQQRPAALVFANPQLASLDKSAQTLEVWDDGRRTTLANLPAAASEASLIQAVMPNSQTWVGAASSEANIKQASIGNFAVLHFAAHAVVDDEQASRSALVLAPGDATQDGLLQMREISDMTLDGQMIVLASCQSAIGADIRGEGVVGLARAFLHAGARAVIGSLWPIEDQHALDFFTVFYRQLAGGATASRAIREAQRQLWTAGLPARAWAGFVVLGDGDWQLASTRGAPLQTALQYLSSAPRKTITNLGYVLVAIALLLFVRVWLLRRTPRVDHPRRTRLHQP